MQNANHYTARQKGASHFFQQIVNGVWWLCYRSPQTVINVSPVRDVRGNAVTAGSGIPMRMNGN